MQMTLAGRATGAAQRSDSGTSGSLGASRFNDLSQTMDLIGSEKGHVPIFEVGRQVATGTCGVDHPGLFISDGAKSYQSHAGNLLADVDAGCISISFGFGLAVVLVRLYGQLESSSKRHATVDLKRRAGHKRSIVGDQVERGLCHLFRVTQTAQWLARDELFRHLLSISASA